MATRTTNTKKESEFVDNLEKMTNFVNRRRNTTKPIIWQTTKKYLVSDSKAPGR